MSFIVMATICRGQRYGSGAAGLAAGGGSVEGSGPRQETYAIEVQRRGPEGWYTQPITPSWLYGRQAADVAVQAFDHYLDFYRQDVESLVASGAHELRVLIRVQGSSVRPSVFTLHGVMEHKVRRNADRRRQALARLEEADGALRSSLRDAAVAGVRQAHLARISGWSRETLRKLTRSEQ
uniref:hypothetical protein n=1 Tax=Streptomyces chartreusis TaxID=1969 RepID=UPI003F49AA60